MTYFISRLVIKCETVRAAMAGWRLDGMIEKAAREPGYRTLRPKQLEVIRAFVSGHDIFVSLPTGSGKSLCFALLPSEFDRMWGLTETTASIVIVVSPLISLMQDQVKSLRSKGVDAVYAGAAHNEGWFDNVARGQCQVLLISPESLLTSFVWRKMLLCSSVYQEKLVGLVIDEAHCVKKW